MNNVRQQGSTFIVLLLVALLAMGAGFVLYQYSATPQPAQLKLVHQDGGPTAITKGSKRPDFSLPDLSGKMHNISEWDGKVLLINFWATWCPPCRREMPDFVDLRELYNEQGFEIIGIAIDNVPAITQFATEIGVNYPILHGEQDAMDIVKLYGNDVGALPYSLLLDREGKVQLTRAGELHREELEKALLELL